MEAARLVFAVTDNQRINLDNIDTRFVPADLVPDGILPTDRRYTMILHPLYYKDSQLRFALFETGLWIKRFIRFFVVKLVMLYIE